MPAIEHDSDLTVQAERLSGAVRAAGDIALKFFRADVRSWTKGNASPVSEADIAVDEFLHERLANTDIAWLSEETEDDPTRLQMRRVWVIDPIDGTRGYIAGKPDWSISAALVEDGRPVVGVLFAPATDDFYLAVAGGGATLNNKPIMANSGDSLAAMRVAGPQSAAARLPTDTVIVPKIHSLALRIAKIANGALDAAFAGGNSHDWDLAAADLLVHEAGGTLTDIQGQILAYNRPEPVHSPLIAAGLQRHAALMARFEMARFEKGR